MTQDAGREASRDLSGAFGRPLTSSLRGLLPPRAARPEAVPAEVDGEFDDEFDDELDDGFDDEVDEDVEDELEDELDEEPGDDVDGVVPGEQEVPVRDDRPGPAPTRRGSPAPAVPVRAAPARTVDAARVGARPVVGESRENGARAPRTSARTPAAPSTAAPAPRRVPTAGTNRRWGIARIASRDHVDLLVLLALDRGPGDGRDVIARLRADSGNLLDAPEQTVHRTLHRLVRNRLLVRRVDRAGRVRYTLSDTGRRSMAARVREWRALSRAVDTILESGS